MTAIRSTADRRHRQVRALVATVSLLLGLGVALPAVAQEPDSDGRVIVDAATVADAHDPSVSADGRWIVFGGTLDGRRTVLRTDRVGNETVELSSLPVGVRGGDTINARLSADGCVVVAVTEIPFDLFRDDDRDLRWDVYRLVLPECGGQVNGWELVSTADSTGIARDDASIDSVPAVSGSGAQIAYVHPAAAAPEGVSTITVVDITVPIDQPGRLQVVAGMPPESPGGAFLYRGARDPAISQNGRHLAFVSDTTASDLLPGWGDGPVPGDFATSQVFVWDRGARDQRNAVRLISGRDGVPSAAGGGEPAMSEDGRIVAFSSRDRTLVPAELNCAGECPLQIYRFDRDTDRNGIFDEPARRPQLAIVSAVDAGVVEAGLPVAGNRSSWSPALSADGNQIAFVTDATNLLPSRRGGGGDAGDGDLLVAEFQLGEIRRVLDGPDATAVPGAHSNPALSKTGEVLVFDTIAGPAIGRPTPITGGGRRTVVAIAVTPRLSLASLDFGTVVLGFESTELYATVLNAGPAAFEPTDVTTSSPNFKITGGSCFRGIIVAAGTSCSIKLTFNPTEPRAFSAQLSVRGRGPGAPSVVADLRGAAGDPALLVTPGGVDFADGIVGTLSDRKAIDLGNVGFFPVAVRDITIGGAHPEDFRIVSEACTGGRALNPDAKCAVELEFVPRGAGYRSALIVATADSGAYTAAVLGGFARYEPVFLKAEDSTARPGEQIGVGGSGFPPNVTLTIGFQDGGAPFATAQTSPNGTFLAALTVPARVRIGPRQLVASAPGGVIASFQLDVLGSRDTQPPVVPGFGLG
jgi:Tol biopolymer transport system component